MIYPEIKRIITINKITNISFVKLVGTFYVSFIGWAWNMCQLIKVNLAKQTLALEKIKKYAKLIRVKNNVESRKKKQRILLKSMQTEA